MTSDSHLFLGRLSGMLGHLLPADKDIHQELVRYSVDVSLPSFKEGESMVEWWGHVFDKPDKYPALSAMVKCCLFIFHGPRVESSFSLMNEVIDHRSGNMNIPTFNAIQTVKYTLQSREKTAVELFKREDVNGEVDRTLCKNIRSAAATYKRQLQQSLQEKQQQQSMQQVWLPSIWQCSADQKADSRRREEGQAEACGKTAKAGPGDTGPGQEEKKKRPLFALPVPTHTHLLCCLILVLLLYWPTVY